MFKMHLQDIGGLRNQLGHGKYIAAEARAKPQHHAHQNCADVMQEHGCLEMHEQVDDAVDNLWGRCDAMLSRSIATDVKGNGEVVEPVRVVRAALPQLVDVKVEARRAEITT